MGRLADALAEIRRAQALDPLSLIIRSVEARVWYYAREYDQMLAQPPTGSEFDAAQAWSQLGETDKALDLLERVYANRDYYVLYFKVHPNLDPFRHDPRLQDLLRRVGLAD